MPGVMDKRRTIERHAKDQWSKIMRSVLASAVAGLGLIVSMSLSGSTVAGASASTYVIGNIGTYSGQMSADNAGNSYDPDGVGEVCECARGHQWPPSEVRLLG